MQSAMHLRAGRDTQLVAKVGSCPIEGGRSSTSTRLPASPRRLSTFQAGQTTLDRVPHRLLEARCPGRSIRIGARHCPQVQ